MVQQIAPEGLLRVLTPSPPPPQPAAPLTLKPQAQPIKAVHTERRCCSTAAVAARHPPASGTPVSRSHTLNPEPWAPAPQSTALCAPRGGAAARLLRLPGAPGPAGCPPGALPGWCQPLPWRQLRHRRPSAQLDRTASKFWPSQAIRSLHPRSCPPGRCPRAGPASDRPPGATQGGRQLDCTASGPWTLRACRLHSQKQAFRAASLLPDKQEPQVSIVSHLAQQGSASNSTLWHTTGSQGVIRVGVWVNPRQSRDRVLGTNL